MSSKSGAIDGLHRHRLNSWAHLADEFIKGNQFQMPLDTGMNEMKHKQRAL